MEPTLTIKNAKRLLKGKQKVLGGLESISKSNISNRKTETRKRAQNINC